MNGAGSLELPNGHRKVSARISAWLGLKCGFRMKFRRFLPKRTNHVTDCLKCSIDGPLLLGALLLSTILAGSKKALFNFVVANLVLEPAPERMIIGTNEGTRGKEKCGDSASDEPFHDVESILFLFKLPFHFKALLIEVVPSALAESGAGRQQQGTRHQEDCLEGRHLNFARLHLTKNLVRFENWNFVVGPRSLGRVYSVLYGFLFLAPPYAVCHLPTFHLEDWRWGRWPDGVRRYF